MVLWVSGLDGQGLGPNAFVILATGLGTWTNFLALPPYLTIARLKFGALTSFENALELKPWWRVARLPNETKAV
jgi:hypothetical protein